MHSVRLDHHADFTVWRHHARELCGARIPPHDIRFMPPDRTDPILDLGITALMNDRRNVVASTSFMEMAERVVCHSDPSRYDRLYALLWRLQSQPSLMRNRVDDEVRWLIDADKAVRRDRHKMHAFVRFRKVGETDQGREQFMAWFEPSYFIVDLASGFFMRRFPNMDWAILTPYRSAIWTDNRLRFEAGGKKEDVPDADIVEDQWKTYFTSTFNPARLKISAMTAEMPKKYWKNLPEAALIPSLIQGAETRETQLIDSVNHTPNPIADKATYRPDRPVATLSPPDLTNLSVQVQSCRRCPLWDGATQGVTGVGPKNARLMIVGEQPGDQEDLTGTPFVGPAGDLLTRAMAEAGLSRSEAYITNAVKHFKYAVRGQRRIHKTPTVAEIRACNVWLNREIELVQPDLLLCLGASAARAVHGHAMKIAESRGQSLTRSDGLRTLLTTHPAYVLRVQGFEDQPKAYADFVQDLRSAAKLLAA